MDEVIFLKLNGCSQCACDPDSYNTVFFELGMLMGPCAFRWLSFPSTLFQPTGKIYLYGVVVGHVTFTYIIYILNLFMFYFLSLHKLRTTWLQHSGKCLNKYWHQYCIIILCYEIAVRLSESTSSKAFRLLWKQKLKIKK